MLDDGDFTQAIDIAALMAILMAAQMVAKNERKEATAKTRGRGEESCL